LWRGLSAPDPISLGKLAVLPRPLGLAVFKGSASQQRKGRLDRVGGNGRGGEEKNGETGEWIARKGRR